MKTDKDLKSDVEAELRWEPSVHDEQIGVSVKDGVVQLSGEVGSYAERIAAERAALRVADVKAAAVEIAVIPNPANSYTDEDIARTARDHLAWNPMVPSAIKVAVSDGWATLSGTVSWQFQREAATESIRFLKGIKGVSNQVQLKPPVSPVDVKGKIEQALHRSAALDSKRITVSATGGEVTLRGRVRSWAEKTDAESAAWAAPGVQRVENLIAVE